MLNFKGNFSTIYCKQKLKMYGSFFFTMNQYILARLKMYLDIGPTDKLVQ